MKSINLTRIRKSDPQLRGWMAAHYSAPKGFVGRQLIYLVLVDGIAYGAVVAGSATRFLPGREEFFGCSIPLNNIVNNTFFHIEKQGGGILAATSLRVLSRPGAKPSWRTGPPIMGISCWVGKRWLSCPASERFTSVMDGMR